MMEVLELLSKDHPHAQTPFRLAPKVEVGRNYERFGMVPVPAWEIVLSADDDTLKGLESFRRLQEELAASEEALQHAKNFYHRGDGLPLTPQDLARYFETAVIKAFLLNYLFGLEHPTFEIERFDAIYEPHEEWLLTGSHTVRSTAILQAFRGPEESIEIAEGVKIRRATNEDFSQLVDAVGRENQGIGYGRSILEVERKVKKLQGVDNTESLKIIQDVLTALRLTKAGGVYCTTVFSTRKGSTRDSSYSILPTPEIVQMYEVTSPKDISGFKEVYRLLTDSTIAPEVETAIRRFNYAYERWRLDDQITDLVIALESMYVPDGGSGEISYKFKTRFAALLGKESKEAERRRLRDLAQLGYDVRSLLVHGSKAKKKVMHRLRKLGFNDLQELHHALEESTRESILTFIRMPGLLDACVLDDLIFGLRNTKTTSG